MQGVNQYDTAGIDSFFNVLFEYTKDLRVEICGKRKWLTAFRGTRVFLSIDRLFQLTASAASPAPKSNGRQDHNRMTSLTCLYPDKR